EGGGTGAGSFASKGLLARFVVLFAGSAMNFALAVVLFAAAFMGGLPTPTLMRVEIGAVQPGSPAEAAGLQPGDVILAVADQPAKTLDDVQRTTRSHPGETVPFQIDPTPEQLTVPAT